MKRDDRRNYTPQFTISVDYRNIKGIKTFVEVRSKTDLRVSEKNLRAELEDRYQCCVKVENPKIKKGGLLMIMLFKHYRKEDLESYLQSYLSGQGQVL